MQAEEIWSMKAVGKTNFHSIEVREAACSQDKDAPLQDGMDGMEMGWKINK